MSKQKHDYQLQFCETQPPINNYWVILFILNDKSDKSDKDDKDKQDDKDDQDDQEVDKNQ